MLNDQSVFQFNYLKKESGQTIFRYAFYQCPIAIMTYEEFLILNELDLEEVGMSLVDEYDQYISTMPVNKSALCILPS